MSRNPVADLLGTQTTGDAVFEGGTATNGRIARVATEASESATVAQITTATLRHICPSTCVALLVSYILSSLDGIPTGDSRLYRHCTVPIPIPISIPVLVILEPLNVTMRRHLLQLQ